MSHICVCPNKETSLLVMGFIFMYLDKQKFRSFYDEDVAWTSDCTTLDIIPNKVF